MSILPHWPIFPPTTDPIFVIMEYVAKGKLQDFLRKSRAEQDYNNLHGEKEKWPINNQSMLIDISWNLKFAVDIYI